MPHLANRTYRKEPKPNVWTLRQRQLIVALWGGLTRPEIAAILGISRDTVGHHISRIYIQGRAANRVEFFRRHNAAQVSVSEMVCRFLRARKAA